MFEGLAQVLYPRLEIGLAIDAEWMLMFMQAFYQQLI
jgi:hypothetical protein